MFRSIIMAIGVFLLILGGETLIVDRVVLADRQATSSGGNPSQGSFGTTPAGPFQNAGYQSYYGSAPRTGPVPRRVVQTKDWMPWSLLAAGTIVVLYSYSIAPIGGGDG